MKRHAGVRPTTLTPRLHNLLRILLLAFAALCAANMAVLSIHGPYQLRLGPLSIPAHSLFKSLQNLEIVFLVSLVVLGCQAQEKPAGEKASGRWLWVGLLILLAVGLYLPSLGINPLDPEWNFANASASIHGLRDVAKLFTVSPVYGFYRPVTFLSLLIDNRVFGTRLWGYHIQSVAFHFLNCVLVWVLARSLRLPEFAGKLAALLFAALAADFEAVLWPARFDLMAASFTLLALISTIHYVRNRGNGTKLLLGGALFLALGIMCKESSYCYALVAPCLIWFVHDRESFAIPRRKLIALGAVSGSVIGAMVFVRMAIYHGIGGYASLAERSVHLRFGRGTVVSLLTRIPLSLFGINTTFPFRWWVLAGWLGFGALLVLSIALGLSSPRRHSVLLACAVLSAVPTLNILSWVNESMEQSRYLYMPAIWTALFLAMALEKHPRGKWLAGAFLVVNAIALEHNLNAYRTMLQMSESISSRIGGELAKKPPATVVVQGLPHDPFGALFFDSDLVARLQARIPGATVTQIHQVCARDCCFDALFSWDSRRMDLVRQATPAACASETN